MKKKPTRFVIFNADDLGRTPGINSGIFEAHRRGLVTSATLMVAFPAAAQAASEADRCPDLGIGLHVALTGGAPILPPEQVPSLVDASGRLAANPEGFGDLDPEQVRLEIEAQLDRFRTLMGRQPTHFDSHHHSHRHPTVCDALIEVAGNEGLPVRTAGPQVDRKLKRASIARTDAFVEDFFGSEARLDVLMRILEDLGPGVTEIMCHPAHVDEELRRTSSYAEPREVELAVLTRPELPTLLEAEDIIPTHFGLL